MKRVSKRTTTIGLIIIVFIACCVYAVGESYQGSLKGIHNTEAIDVPSSPVAQNSITAGNLGGPAALKRELLDSDSVNSASAGEKTKLSVGYGVAGLSDQDSASGQVASDISAMGIPGNYIEKIVRTASLEIRIKKNKFDYAYDNAADIVTRAGGYISGSRSTTTEDKIAGGELTIRVPARNFDNVLKALKGLGKIKNQEISSEEVSLEYVDLQSRLRNWRAQEAVMLDLMKRAKTISESISIQNNLQQIQMEIEQISGRLQYLDDRTSYSEIKLTINEPSAVPAKAEAKDVFGLKAALREALKASSSVLSSMIIAVGYVLPILIIAMLSVLIYRPLKKRAVAS